MDMRVRAGSSPAAAACAEHHPPLRLLQRWQPPQGATPAGLGAASDRSTSLLSRLQKLFNR